MALARYFHKAALSAASLLRGMDYSTVQRVLEGQVVAMRYDASAVASQEGRWTVELLVNLLARLYPSLVIVPLNQAERTLEDLLVGRARAINPLIDIVPSAGSATISVVVGATAHDGAEPTMYVGSNDWTVRTSSRSPVGSGASDIPFGAGAAACLGAAWVFRQVFREYPPFAGSSSHTDPDPEAMEASLIDLGPHGVHALELAEIDIGESFLVGVGAVGNAAVWALARTPGLHGQLHLIDGERLDISNVQRYVLTDEADEDREKVEVAAEEWVRAADERGEPRNRLAVTPHPSHWAEFVQRRGDYQFERVLLALDSAEDRIAVQASLPRWVVNAWTQPENLGVSRHEFIGSGPCVACLYLPRGSRRNLDEMVAEAIRAEGPEALMEIRAKLHSGEPIGAEFVRVVAERVGIPVEPLLPFANASLHAFFTQAVCGGVLLGLGAELGPARPTEVPMAFQSAMAGILLAAELVVDAGALRGSALPARTELNLLRPAGMVALRPHSPALKDESGRCLCADEVFRRAYLRKYDVSPDPVTTGVRSMPSSTPV
jgi:enoyl-CoA hydratase/carnithine racemase